MGDKGLGKSIYHVYGAICNIFKGELLGNWMTIEMDPFTECSWITHI
jgi:hypothetical protein